MLTFVSLAQSLRPSSKLGYIYVLLVGLRVYSALFGYAYIHPDEWVQSGEPLLALVHNVTGLRTSWEWDPHQAIRSITSLSSASFPLNMYSQTWSDSCTGYQLFLLQRVNVLMRSFVIDFAIKFSFPEETAHVVLCLLASSTATTTFLVRPFSNSFETQMLAVCFICALTIQAKTSLSQACLSTREVVLLVGLGFALAEGIFARFTFAIFVLPLLGYLALLILLLSRKARQCRTALTITIILAAGFGCRCWTLMSSDTERYTKLALSSGTKTATTLGTRWVIAPINALLYNLRTENVAQHGLHPRWLHICVNWPLMFGVSCCYAIIVHALAEAKRVVARVQSGISRSRADEKKATSRDGASRACDRQQSPKIVRLSLIIILFSLTVLSISPHQEPRFLLPLTLPCVIVFADALRSTYFVARPRLTRLLLVLYAVQHGMQLMFFGFAHQGGLLPALFAVDDMAANVSGGDKHVVIWRTFDVPLHLVPRLGQATLQSFSGSTKSPSLIYEMIAEGCDRTTIILPAYAVQDLQSVVLQQGSKIYLEKSQRPFWPHVDTDHLGETAEVARQKGWFYATILHMLHVKCNKGYGPSLEAAMPAMPASPAPASRPSAYAHMTTAETTRAAFKFTDRIDL